MNGSLGFKATIALVAGICAYAVSAVIVAFLFPSQSALWPFLLVLFVDLMLAVFSACLTDFAKPATSQDDELNDPASEAVGIAVATIAPLCMQAVKFGLSPADSNAATESIIGAQVALSNPTNANVAYLGVLMGWCFISGFCAFLAANVTRSSSSLSYWTRFVPYCVCLVMLIGGSLFLLPWTNQEAVKPPPFGTIAVVAIGVGALYAVVVHLVRIASAAFNAARKVATPFLSLAFMIGSEVLAASVVSLLIFGLLSEFWDRFKINDAWVKPIESVFAGIFLIASVIMVVVGLALALVFFGLKFVLYIASKLSWESVAFRLPAGVGVFVARIAVAAVLTFSAYKLWEITRPPASQASTQIGAANKSESKLPEAIEPIPALTFIDAPVTCSSTRWKLAERMQVEAPLEDCSIYSSADYLVLVGSASPRGGTPSEPLRAKDRGYNLTKQVKQLKPSAETKVFVLNKGIEQNEALETAPPLQAYEGRSVVDSAKVQEASFIRDFSKYLSDPSKVTPHSNCELYRVTFGRGDSDPKMQLVTGWKCPH